ncbi:MAG: hypothetical protein CMJ24_05475 [Phycisphaerae bacterium]|nr:hypothetical protein [Phycisphaerae bacterium]|tara:strand:- start:631 stop:1164 length:534 start_codon:yes stop_codon:yes gene_type:complete
MNRHFSHQTKEPSTMHDLARTLLIGTFACLVPLTGCDKKEPEQTKETIEEKVDMNLVDESKFGEPVHFTDPDEVPTEKLGNVDVGGSTLEISTVGLKQPNATLTVNIDHVSGPVPDTIRLWIGSRSGEGSVKSKADAHGDHWHGDATFPDVMTSRTALWIEIEDENGERVSTGMPIH